MYVCIKIYIHGMTGFALKSLIFFFLNPLTWEKVSKEWKE